MDRDTAVKTWREVCGSDTVMAMGVVTGRMLEEFARRIEAEERERWQRIATNAQAVTNGGEDKLDYFEVPSHLMAALALALDEGPNVAIKPRRQASA
jgi:hypothetical protein